MREINKISESLFEKIRDRYEDVSLGDENAKATQNPEEARFFNFDYVVDGKNYGNITLSIIDEMSLKVYFSKNISRDLEGDERKNWYSFLRELREFAKRNLLSFEPRDITRSTLKHRDIQQVSKADSTYTKDELVSESRMYGTINRSYEDFGPVRIKVAHAKPIMDETHGARSRNIEAIFVENDQGERFRMPFNSLIGTRAMARHISAGGTPTDEFGSHIREMIEEMTALRPFVHSMRHRTFEDTITNEMLDSCFEYHSLLKNTLKKLKGKKGYNEYKESYTPALIEDEFNEEEIRDKFVKKTFPKKLEAALPIVHKAYSMSMKKENTNPYASQFESWATRITEGTWAVPETEEQIQELISLMSSPLEAGVDGENASSALYNLVGNDDLFDMIDQQAQENGPESDVRPTVMTWIEKHLPDIASKIEKVISDETPVSEMSGHGDTPIDNMTRAELLDYLNASPEEVMNVSDDELRAAANERAESLPEGTYGSADGGIDGVVYEEYCDACDRTADQCVCEDHYDEDQVDSIANAIIRRILNNIGEHSELLKKAGPDGVLNAARDVASFHAPVEELGTSDISNMVREVYLEVGVEYPKMNEGRVKEVAIDLEELTDEEFKAKYGKTKEEMKVALSEGLSGLQKFGAGAALVGALAGNAYMGQKSVEADPYVQKLEQQYQQVLQASDTAYSQGDMAKVKQLDALKDKIEDKLEDAKASAELGIGSEEEGLREMRRLAGL